MTAEVLSMEQNNDFNMVSMVMKDKDFVQVSSDGLSQLSDAVDKLDLGHRHRKVQDWTRDPASVVAIHQPDEFAAFMVIGDRAHNLGPRTVPSPGWSR